VRIALPSSKALFDTQHTEPQTASISVAPDPEEEAEQPHRHAETGLSCAAGESAAAGEAPGAAGVAAGDGVAGTAAAGGAAAVAAPAAFGDPTANAYGPAADVCGTGRGGAAASSTGVQEAPTAVRNKE